jgi:predicted amidophosphoribosyltransferase
MNQENIQLRKEDEIYCPNCAKPIKKDAVICPHCGIQIKELKASDKDNIISPKPERKIKDEKPG